MNQSVFLLVIILFTSFLQAQNNAVTSTKVIVSKDSGSLFFKNESKVVDGHTLMPKDLILRLKFSLFFEKDNVIIKMADLFKFSQLIDSLDQHPELKIAIIAYSDSKGQSSTNEFRSLKMAHAVANIFLNKNVNPLKIGLIEGRSITESVENNTAAKGEAMNRRVEVYFMQESKKLQTVKLANDSVNHTIKELPLNLKNDLEKIIKKKNISADVEMEIDGMLVDETKTKSGKDFYDLFYAGWEAPEKAKDFTITVAEKPFRLTSTLIVVSINDNPVYQSVLQPRMDLIEMMSEEAIAITKDYLLNYEEIIKQMNGDDMSGSGIF